MICNDLCLTQLKLMSQINADISQTIVDLLLILEIAYSNELRLAKLKAIQWKKCKSCHSNCSTFRLKQILTSIQAIIN